jgi:hypothetical protein
MAEAALKSTGDGYHLTFAPAVYREDGSFHELRVENSAPEGRIEKIAWPQTPPVVSSGR